jgi:tetratricopeptide (TPR) repeat protein
LRPDEPTDDDLHYDALALAERGRHEQAVELLSQLIGRSPNRIGAYYARATSHEKSGDLGLAIADLRHVATMDQEDSVARFNLARLLIRAGNLVEARAHLRTAWQMDPDEAAHPQGLAHVALELGREALNEGDVERALTQFRTAEKRARESLALNSRLPWTHADLGASLAEQYRCQDNPDPGLMDEAIAAYQREFDLWSELGPGGGQDQEAHDVVVTNLCDAYLLIGDLEGGLVFCSTAARATPEDPVAFYNLAGAFALAGRTDEALEALERDLELGDTDYGYLEHDSWFDPIRDDPRFADLLRRMRAAAADQS